MPNSATTLDPFAQTTQKSHVNPTSTIGMIPDGREGDYEKEPGTSPIPSIIESAWDPLVSELNGLRREAGSAMADLLNIATGAETTLVNKSSGSIEDFNKPHGAELNSDEVVAEARRIFQEAKKVQAHYESIDTQIDQVSQLKAVEEDARFELNVMLDDEFAQKADYKNTSFRAALKTVANRVYVFGKLITEKLKLIKEKEESAIQILGKRTSAKGTASGGGDLLMNATAQEGQSAIANAVRGSG